MVIITFIWTLYLVFIMFLNELMMCDIFDLSSAYIQNMQYNNSNILCLLYATILGEVIVNA